MRNKIIFWSLLMVLLTPINLLAVDIDAYKKVQNAIEKASVEYVEKRKNEVIAEYNKKAVLAIYRKIYPGLSTNEKQAFSELGKLTLGASRLNGLAADLASGDPAKIQSASETLAVDIGTKLADQLADPYVREKMSSLMGSANQIFEISKVLGQASGGDKKALAEYAANMIINATGGAGIVGFYTTAYGAMKFVKDAYVDATIEDLYQQYKSGDLNKDQLMDAIDYRKGYHVAIRDKVIAEREKIVDGFGDSINLMSPELRERLTYVDYEEYTQKMIAGFDARKDKEKKEAIAQEDVEKRKEDTKEVLGILDGIAYEKYGKDWIDGKRWWDLGRFMESVYITTKDDIAFDSNDILDLKAVGRYLSTTLVYGRNSDEYKEALKEFNEIRKRNLEFKGIVEKGKGQWSGRFIGSRKIYYAKKYMGTMKTRMTLFENGNNLNGTAKILSVNGHAYKKGQAEQSRFKGVISQNTAELNIDGETVFAKISSDGNTITFKANKQVFTFRRE